LVNNGAYIAMGMAVGGACWFLPVAIISGFAHIAEMLNTNPFNIMSDRYADVFNR